ncbi:MAG: hypothetical protein HY320_06330 [Armatimonadetes bacterium]|nr:hypothetical protein [Armatimonadota bacterium]
MKFTLMAVCLGLAVAAPVAWAQSSPPAGARAPRQVGAAPAANAPSPIEAGNVDILKNQPVMPNAVESEYTYGLPNPPASPVEGVPREPSVPHAEAAGGFNWVVGLVVLVGLGMLVLMGKVAWGGRRARMGSAGH